MAEFRIEKVGLKMLLMLVSTIPGNLGLSDRRHQSQSSLVKKRCPFVSYRSYGLGFQVEGVVAYSLSGD